jgi:transcription elongation factor Elf1
LNKKPRRSRSKRKQFFYCFACKHSHPISDLARKGRRASGATWALCKECSDAYKREREMDREAYHAAEGDILTGENEYTKMGWNGVPSDRSLRKRRT